MIYPMFGDKHLCINYLKKEFSDYHNNDAAEIQRIPEFVKKAEKNRQENEERKQLYAEASSNSAPKKEDLYHISPKPTTTIPTAKEYNDLRKEA